MKYCEQHNPKRPVASPGGTWCTFHKKEICCVLRSHCKICGVWLESEEEFQKKLEEIK